MNLGIQTSMLTKQELDNELRNRCAIAQLPTATVLGDGSLDSEIVVIAEAPGGTEEQLGKPLVGGSGRFLWEQLRKYNITRNNCYITNVVKYRLVSNDGTDDNKIKVSVSEMEHWHGILRYELAQLKKAKYVLVLGNMALTAVSGHKGIQKWRGSVVSLDGITYLFTLNPAAVLRDSMWSVIFALDIGKFHRVLKHEHREPTISAQINPSPLEAIQFITKLIDEKAPVSLDIETVANESACIGLANSVASGMCVNFRTRESNRFSLEDEKRVRRAIQALVSHPSIRLVVQNGVFDASWLWYKDRIRLRNVWFDTLLAHHSLYPALPHNLGFLTTQYTDHPYYKDDKETWKEGGDIDSFWRYNVKDCCITLMVQRRLYNELINQKMDQFFFNHVMRLQPHIVEMNILGVKVDSALKERITGELAQHVNDLRTAFYRAVAEATGDDNYQPSPASPKQLAELYFSKLKLVGRGTSTDKDNRTRMRAHPRTSEAAKRVIDAHNDYAKEAKFLSTYATTQIDEDGRYRTEYKQYGTQSAPGRLSSSETAWNTGGNTQNIPERAKEMFVADPDYCFVYFDMAQIEARIVGWLADIKTWKAQFERARLEGGYDAHRALAADMFEIPYDQTPTKDFIDGEPSLRYIAKRSRHGMNYTLGPDELAIKAKLPLNKAQDAYIRYHRTNPEIKKWWKATEDELRSNRCLTTPYGRRLLLLGRFDPDIIPTAIAFVPQSTAGDHVCGTIYLCHDDPEWPTTARIVLNIHDALIALCRVEDAKRVGKIMQKHAERPVLIKGEPLIIPAELAYSQPENEYKMDPCLSTTHRWSTLKK